MKIYLIEPKGKLHIDECYGCVVIAESSDEAIKISIESCWNYKDAELIIKELGIANKKQEKGCILAASVGY